MSQTHNEANGKLGKFHTVGNLWRIRLNVDRQTGTWQINIKSSGPYTLTVRGEILYVYLVLSALGFGLTFKVRCISSWCRFSDALLTYKKNLLEQLYLNFFLFLFLLEYSLSFLLATEGHFSLAGSGSRPQQL